MEHMLSFSREEQAEKALAVIQEKIDESSWLTEPEKDHSCSVHFATDGLLTEQHKELIMALGADILDLNNDE